MRVRSTFKIVMWHCARYEAAVLEPILVLDLSPSGGWFAIYHNLKQNRNGFQIEYQWNRVHSKESSGK